MDFPTDELVERAAATILPYELESMLRHNWTDEGIAVVKRYMARGVLASLLEAGATIEEVGEPGYWDHHGADGAFVAPGHYLVLRLDAAVPPGVGESE